MGCYTFIEEGDIMQISVIWMELEDVMLNEVNQKKDKHMMTSIDDHI